MRKLYILFLFFFTCTIAAYSQPILEMPDATVDAGESFCIPVSASFFDDILLMEFTMHYDETVLVFDFVQNINFGDANSGPLTVTPGALGEINVSFNHEDFDCTSNPFPGFEPLTNPGEGQTIFEICFTADAGAGYGGTTLLEIGPPAVTERHGSINPITGGCNNLGFFEADPSNITIGVRPVIFTASDEVASEGELFCQDFTFTGFDELQSAQFTVNYDPAVLQFNSLIPNDTDIPNNTLGSTYGLPGQGAITPGFITVAWAPNQGAPLPTIPDGTTMFTVCYDVIGACGSPNTSVEFSGDLTSIEFTNGDPDNPSSQDLIPFQFNSGSVSINDCDPTGLEFTVDCAGPFEIGDNPVCVQIQAGTNFQDVDAFNYLVEWNADILEFESITNTNLPGLSFPSSDFNTDNTDNGVLQVDWSSGATPAQSLNNGETVFEICFNIIGLGGDSPIRIIREGGTSVVGGDNMDINPSNCALNITQPESLGLSFEDIFVPIGGQGCVPVTASNFDNLLSVEFSLVWDELLWEFNNVQNISPLFLNATAANFTPFGNSALAFDWENPTALTIPDGTVLFELCFDTGVNAVPNECDLLQLANFPIAAIAISESSAGENIGIEALEEADMCFLFPEGYGITAVGGADGWLDTLCVQFQVDSWDNIVSTDLQIAWNPSELTFINGNDVDITGWNFGTANPVGTIDVSNAAPNPQNVADGTTAFEVCFQLIGDPNECYPVSITTDGQDPTQTTFGEGSVIINDGEICIEEQIVIVDVIVTPASCPDSEDGTVTLIPDERIYDWLGVNDTLGTTWETEGFPTFSPLAIDELPAGVIVYNVFSFADGTIPVLTDSVEVGILSQGPEVMIAGPDTVRLDCNTNLALLTVSNPSDDCTYSWYLNSTDTAPFSFDSNMTFANETGSYIVECIDNTAGCSGRDTVVVLPPVNPVADAGLDPDPGFTCLTDSLILMGTGTGGDVLNYTWSIVNGFGGDFDPATATTENLTVYESGRYQLIVSDPQSGCESEPDVVIVTDDGITPDICIVEEILEQNCDGSPTIFDASCSDNPDGNVTFQWFNADGTEGDTGLMGGFTEIGTHSVVATEETTGCTSTAMVNVVGNISAPVVTIEENDDFTCGVENVALNTTVFPVGAPVTYSWTTSDGGTIAAGTENDPNNVALTPGIYQVIVTNTENNCDAIAIDTVLDLTAQPLISITPTTADSLTLTCFNPTLTLDGTQSDQGADYTHQWCKDGVDILGETGLTLEVSDAGTYALKTLNTATNCEGIDSVMVTTDLIQPPVSLNGLFFELTCEDEIITIEATIPDTINYIFGGWTLEENTGNILSYSMDSLTITVDAPDVYQISITDADNGCPNEADAQVTDNQVYPVLNVAEDTLSFTCLAPTVQLNGTGSSTGNDFVYQWDVVVPGATPNDPTSIITDVSAPGEYLFSVTDTTNNCSLDTLVVVIADTLSPIATIAPVDDITCADMTRNLTVEVSNITDFIVAWSGPAPGPTPDDEVMTTVSAVGEYQAIVTNTMNGCQDTTTVMVGGDIELPTFDFGTIPVFNCDDQSVIIDASASGDEADYSSILWTNATGGVGGNQLIAEAFGTGPVSLSLTFNGTGCTADSTIILEVTDMPVVPAFVGGPTGEVGCDGANVTIDFSGTGDAADFSMITWEAVAGNNNDIIAGANPLIAEATGPGDYMLTLTMVGPAQCMLDTVVTVNVDANIPVADAGPDAPFDCGEVVNLDGTASSQGADFSYEWLVIGAESAPLAGDLTGMTPTVTGAGGTYQIIVSNAVNGCVDTSSIVTATLVLPELANAGEDQIGCEDMVFLEGNQPGGTPAVTGVWTSVSTGEIAINTDPGTEVSNIPFGSSVFVWTLSANGCENYSADSVTITRTDAPVAIDDILELTDGELTGSLDFINNDQLNGAQNYEINVITDPALGAFDSTAFANGTLEFTAAIAEYGLTDMEYELCSLDCPGLCDTATIIINVVAPDGKPFVPNTITPNDDGHNDVLIFDVIILTPADEIPDNELVVFNRWGDIVYEAKPYNNDWGGWNQEGKQLPEATYYYVLRLNIGEGEIVRGDITIIY